MKTVLRVGAVVVVVGLVVAVRNVIREIQALEALANEEGQNLDLNFAE